MTDSLALDDALRYAALHRDETLADLVEPSKSPSIGARPAHGGDVRAAAEWRAGRLRALGMTVEIVEGRAHPIVPAKWMGRPRPSPIARRQAARRTCWSTTPASTLAPCYAGSSFSP
jgi:hypothetical protein